MEEQLLLSHCEPSNAEHVFEVFEFGTGCLCCSSFKQFVATLMTVAASTPGTAPLEVLYSELFHEEEEYSCGLLPSRSQKPSETTEGPTQRCRVFSSNCWQAPPL